jgi:hypothetical protein
MLDFQEPQPQRTEKIKFLTTTKPHELIKLGNDNIQIIGLVRGYEKNRLGEDVVSVRVKGNKSTRTVIVDGISASDENSTERTHVEQLANQFIIGEVGKIPEFKEKELRPVVATDIEVLPNGKYLVGTIGAQDCLTVAFVPDEDGKFSRESLRVLYFNPEAQHEKNHISFYSGKPLKENMQNPHILPKGSIVLSLSDGGLEAIAQLFKQGSNVAINSPHFLKNDLERKESLSYLFEPMMEFINEFGPETIESIIKKMEDYQYGHDYVSAVFALLDGPQKETSDGLLSEDLFPLQKDLSQPSEKTQMRPEDLLLKYGKDKAVKLVSQLVEQGLTGGVFFSRACALIRPDELPKETLQWFLDRGLKILEGENINVFLTMNVNPVTLRACHEIGQYVVDGFPAGQTYDEEMMSKPPKYIAADRLIIFELDEKNPRGRMVEIKPWTGNRFAFLGTPIAGGGSKSRGILLPSDDYYPGRVYLSDDSSFTSGAERRKFFVADTGIDPYLWWGAVGVTQYLQGKINSKAEYIKSGGKPYFER